MALNKVDVEAEGGELSIRNDAGDIAIIPKNLVRKVEGLLELGQTSEIDKIVNSLPSSEDYAEDGSLYILNAARDRQIEIEEETRTIDQQETVEEITEKTEEIQTVEEIEEVLPIKAQEGLTIKNDEGEPEFSTKPLESKTKKKFLEKVKDIGTSVAGGLLGLPVTAELINVGRDLISRDDVQDYSGESEQKTAFEKAKKTGAETYFYKGQTYSTESNLPPKEQFKKYGTINELANRNTKLRNMLQKNIHASPEAYGYGDVTGAYTEIEDEYSATYGKLAPARRVLDDIIYGKGEEKSPVRTRAMQSIYNLYLGKPALEDPGIGISSYAPTSAKEGDENTYFTLEEDKYSVLNEANLRILDEERKKRGMGEDEFVDDEGKPVIMEGPNRQYELGRYNISQGKDKKGTYISYHDEWNLDPLGTDKESTVNKIKDFLGTEDQSFGLGKGIEFYDRLYYKKEDDGTVVFLDNEGNPIDANLSMEERKMKEVESVGKEVNPEYAETLYSNEGTLEDRRKARTERETNIAAFDKEEAEYLKNTDLDMAKTSTDKEFVDYYISTREVPLTQKASETVKALKVYEELKGRSK